jgi:predicted alpha-1,2-mannosidase
MSFLIKFLTFHIKTFTESPNLFLLMKKVLLLLLIIPFSHLQSQWVEKAPENPEEFVNPLIGTLSKPSLSNGNTYPAVAVPHGMNLWTPQTGKNGNGWQYTYDADKIRGIKQTHQPSPWMNDYGMFSIMPVTGKMRFNEEERASWFSHKSEVSKPYYYSIYLADHNVTAEVTPTERAAQLRFTYPNSENSWFVVDAFDKGSSVTIIPSEKKIVGYSTKYSRGKLVGFKNYFVIYADKPFTKYSTWKDKDFVKDALEITGDHCGAVVGFATKKGEKVNLRVASSFISLEQAELNLQRELSKDSFDDTFKKAKSAWNEKLKRVEVAGGTIDQMRTFYSSLYRMLCFPHKMYEVNKNGEVVHYSPYSGKTETGYRFAGTGFWDTFRALYPFLNLVYPSINVEMQKGLISDYKEGGWLPEWSSPSYSDIMIGNNSASVVADAYLKGLRGYDIETLYQALLHGANNEGPQATGRLGIEYYKKLGYVPYDVKINENAARTLEYAYDDFAIAQLGKALGKPESEWGEYYRRSQNFQKIIDPETKLARGRNQDGSFQTPFNPFKWGDAFTEGNSWHYTWSVFQDIDGLAKLMGGKKELSKKLDQVFELPPVFDDSYYGSTIHEIQEMVNANMGQYAHGNQPAQHIIYLYNYSGESWKTQYWVRETMNRLYQPTLDGYCGDEDNGQTSAWYIFSALGFYPVTPATDQYVLGAPLFKKATIHLENGKTIDINADNNSDENRYVKSLKFNGKKYSKNWLSHEELMKGATLKFDMISQPNKERGTDEKDFPYSYSSDKK